MTDTEILGWHFLCDNGARAHDGVYVEPGSTETWDGDLELCASGLHFCVRPLDAVEYARGSLIRRVRLSGQILQPDGEDKGCATERTELWRADITTLLHEFACWCAEQALDAQEARGKAVDPRSRAAVAAKRAWLRGEIDDEALAAAWAAARDAAEAAVWVAAVAVARVAARGAARDAARAAARDAARDADWDADWAAAREAAWAALNAELERRLLALAEAQA